MHFYLKNVFIGRVILVVTLDAACLVAAAWLAWKSVQPEIPPELYAAGAGALSILAFLALFYCNAYQPSVICDGRNTKLAILNSMGLAFVGSLVIYWVATVPSGIVPSLVFAASLYFPMLYFGRVVARALLSSARLTRYVLIIGAMDLANEIAEALSRRQNAGIDLAGFLTDEPDSAFPGACIAGYPVLGKIHHLEKTLSSRRIDHIVVASKGRNDHFPVDALQAAKMSGYRIESGVSFLERVSGKIYLRDLRPSYLIFSDGFRSGRISAAVTRLIDIVGSATALIVAAPLFAACVLAIKLESRGPAFFRQVRVGRGDKPFVMFKLRSMRVDADVDAGAAFAATTRDDPRITRVGHFIRRTRLDELPQLWNILRGEMTLVGPRAERPEFAESLSERYDYYRLRSSVKPGLTGWAQTRFGYVSDVDAYEEKLALDLYYLKHRSLSMDLLILWQTVKTVIMFRGV